MSSVSATIRVLVYTTLLGAAAPLWAQGALAVSGNGEKGESVHERDRSRERDQWFHSGRTPLGEDAAALLNRAFRQKQAMQARQSSAASSTSSNATALASSAAQSWVPLGPRPVISDPTGVQSYGAVTGRVTALVVDAKDPSGNTIYVGAAYGGVWRSQNAAASNPANVSFQSLIEDQPTLAVGAIAVHPTENIILVGTGEPNNSSFSYYGMGILRSADGGSSWSLIRDADNHTHTFAGEGFSAIAFNTDNPSVVIAAVGGTNGDLSGAQQPSSARGLFYSSDKGLTWKTATLAGLSGAGSSATDVIYDPSHQRFFAVVRGHGYFYSSDGANWTRLESQPTSDLAAANCGSDATFLTCPVYRGSLTLRPDTGEIYTVLVDSDGNTNPSGGIFRLTYSFGNPVWARIQQADLDNCGDSGGGCGTDQGVYNLYIRAVPNGNATDLYVGAVNIFKCTVDPTGDNSCSSAGSWKNLTHAYGCDGSGAFGLPGHVHPDQHAMGFSVTPSHYFVYFGNDGGVNRSLHGSQLNSSSCTATNVFDNLNASLESFSQFVSFSQDPADANVILGGLQDNGSPARSASGGNTWQAVNTADGGFNAIDSASPNIWYTANAGITVQRCTLGAGCLPNTLTSVVEGETLGFDSSAFYMPYLLDPQNSSKILAGTCRIWRVNGDGTSATALSNNFSTGDSTTCSGLTFDGDTKIRALAAGGPVVNGNSQLVYAGMTSRVLPAAGKLFVSTQVDGGAATWVDRTGNINPGSFDISDIFVDSRDATGKTAYVAIMGFTGGGGHVWKTIDAGINWTDVSTGLPDAPANSVIIDPRFADQIYVGTDVGVFVSFDGGATWGTLGAGLPSVPAVKLKAFVANGNTKLRVATYGRGMWETELPTAGVLLQPTSLTFGSMVPGFLGTTQIAILTNNRNTPLVISSITSTPEFPIISNNCPSTLPAVGVCSVDLRFLPAGTGSRTGTLQVVANDSTSAHSVAFAGTGVDFSLKLTRPLRPTRTGAEAVLSSGQSLEVPIMLVTPADLSQGVEVNIQCNAGRALRCRVDHPSVPLGANSTATVSIWPAEGRRSLRMAAGTRLASGSYQVTITATAGALSRSAYLKVRLR